MHHDCYVITKLNDMDISFDVSNWHVTSRRSFLVLSLVMYTGPHLCRHITLQQQHHLSLHYPLTRPNQNDNSSTNNPTHAQQPTRRPGSITSTSSTQCLPLRSIPSIHSLHLTPSPLSCSTSPNSYPLSSPKDHLVKYHSSSTRSQRSSSNHFIDGPTSLPRPILFKGDHES